MAAMMNSLPDPPWTFEELFAAAWAWQLVKGYMTIRRKVTRKI